MTEEKIYGFDLGHGETAVSMAGSSSRVEARNLQLTRGGAKVIPTAVASDGPDNTVVGFDALVSPTATDLRAAFKHHDVSDPNVHEPMRRFIRGVLSEMAAIGSPIDGRLVFGHPSGWSKEQWQPYQALLAEIVGQTPMMVAEARAAFLPLKGTGEISQKELNHGRIVIIDMGSSTTDFALVQGVEDPKDLGNPGGVQLGAGLIELALFRQSLSSLDEASQQRVEAFIESHISEHVQLLLAFRKAKEAFFESETAFRKTGRGPKPDLEVLEDQLGVDWAPRITATVMDRCLEEPLADLGVTIDLFGRPTMVTGSWKDEFFDHLEFATDGVDPTTMILTGGAAKMGWVVDEVRTKYPSAEVLRTAEPEHTIANGLALHGSVFERTEAIRSEIDAFVDSTAVEDAIEESWEKGVALIVTPLVDGFVDRFVVPAVIAWRNSEVTSLNGIGERSGELAKAWAESAEGKRALGEASIDWYATEVAPAVNAQVRAIVDKYPDIPSSSIEIPLDHVSFDIDASTTQEAVSGTALMSDIDSVLNGVIVVVSGIVSMAMFGAGSAVIMGTGPGVVVAAAVVAGLGLVIGKDEALRRLNEANISPLIRKAFPQRALVKQIQKKGGEIESEVRQQLIKDLTDNEAAKQQVADGVSALIDGALKKRVRDASAHLV